MEDALTRRGSSSSSGKHPAPLLLAACRFSVTIFVSSLLFLLYVVVSRSSGEQHTATAFIELIEVGKGAGPGFGGGGGVEGAIGLGVFVHFLF